MKKIWILILLCCSVYISGQSNEEFEKEKVEKIGQSLPDFRFISLNNDTVYSAQLQGKITLFDFWAYFCPPCRAKLRPQNEMYNRLKEHPDFQFLSIASVERKGVSPIVKEYGLSHEVYTTGDAKIMEVITYACFPTTVITDREGKIVYWERGGATKEDGARSRILKLEERLVSLLNE